MSESCKATEHWDIKKFPHAIEMRDTANAVAEVRAKERENNVFAGLKNVRKIFFML